MANPQLKDGYTRIANELMEALYQTYFPSGERRVLDAVIRKTYGWHKKEDRISISQITEMTKMAKRTVIYATQNLEAKNVLVVTKEGIGKINSIMLNKDYESWKLEEVAPQVARNRALAKEASAKRRAEAKKNGSEKFCTSAKPCKKPVQNSVKKVKSFAHTKETITKENTKNKFIYLTDDSEFKNSSSSASELDFWILAEEIDEFGHWKKLVPLSAEIFNRFLAEIYKKQLSDVSLEWRDLRNSEEDCSALVWLLQNPNVRMRGIIDAMAVVRKINSDRVKGIYNHPTAPSITSFSELKAKYTKLQDYSYRIMGDTKYQRVLESLHEEKKEKTHSDKIWTKLTKKEIKDILEVQAQEEIELWEEVIREEFLYSLQEESFKEVNN